MNLHLLALGLALGASTVGLALLGARYVYRLGVRDGATRATEAMLGDEVSDTRVEEIVDAIREQRERAGARRPN